MTSAVFDAALCLLLVSAAVVTVGDARRQATEPTVETASDPDETVALLSSVTRAVHYDTPVESDGPDRAAPTAADRLGETRHGTLAELLAFAAVRSVTVDGTRLFTGSASLSNAVEAAVRPILEPRTRVVARWTPIHRGHVGSRVAVGPRPPPEADVRAAALSVPVPALATDSTASRIDKSDLEPSPETVAHRAATTFVAVLFPPNLTTATLFEATRRAKLLRQRYERVGAVYGIDDPDPSTPDRVPTANDRLVEAVAGRFSADLERGRATESSRLAVGRVRIVVRTWSR